jgi:hypothetical protein
VRNGLWKLETFVSTVDNNQQYKSKRFFHAIIYAIAKYTITIRVFSAVKVLFLAIPINMRYFQHEQALTLD